MALSANAIREVLLAFASGRVSILHLEWIPGRSPMLGVTTSQGERLGDLFPADLDAVLTALHAQNRLLISRTVLNRLIVRRVDNEFIVERVE